MEMHTLIVKVADRMQAREVSTLSDFYEVGRLIVTNEISYDDARDQMVAAFEFRAMSAGTAKVYVSQGYALSQLFDTFAELEEFADDDCKGSRSLKRIYDATRVKGDKADDEAEGDATEAVAPKADLVDVVLAGLANLKSAADIARVRDAAIAMLKVSKAA